MQYDVQEDCNPGLHNYENLKNLQLTASFHNTRAQHQSIPKLTIRQSWGCSINRPLSQSILYITNSILVPT